MLYCLKETLDCLKKTLDCLKETLDCLKETYALLMPVERLVHVEMEAETPQTRRSSVVYMRAGFAGVSAV
jgi:hypothetical protein